MIKLNKITKRFLSDREISDSGATRGYEWIIEGEADFGTFATKKDAISAVRAYNQAQKNVKFALDYINQGIDTMVENYIANCEDCGSKKEMFLQNINCISDCFTETSADVDAVFAQEEIDFFWEKTKKSLQSELENRIAATIIDRF